MPAGRAGKLSKSTAARICTELRERFEAFQRRDLYDIHLAVLFLDATFLARPPERAKEGVLVAWGFAEAGERVLLAVMQGMRESHEDWLALAARFDRPRAHRLTTTGNLRHGEVTAAKGRDPDGGRSYRLLGERQSPLRATGA